MADDGSMDWVEAPASSVRIGDRVRHRGSEFVIARVDSRFLGRDDMICFIEDTSQRWHAYPARLEQIVLVFRGA